MNESNQKKSLPDLSRDTIIINDCLVLLKFRNGIHYNTGVCILENTHYTGALTQPQPFSVENVMQGEAKREKIWKKQEEGRKEKRNGM
jgi:hypothetical protein